MKYPIYLHPPEGIQCKCSEGMLLKINHMSMDLKTPAERDRSAYLLTFMAWASNKASLMNDFGAMLMSHVSSIAKKTSKRA